MAAPTLPNLSAPSLATRQVVSTPSPPIRAASEFPIKAPAIVEKAKALGMEMVQSTPESSKKFYEGQMALWAPIVKASGAKVE